VIDGSARIVFAHSPIKSGKEATVHCCVAGEDDEARLVAGKFYESMAARGFRNDAVYQEGRSFNSRDRRALGNRSAHGRAVQFQQWVSNEYQMLKRVHDAGGDVPAPFVQSGSFVLMQYFGSSDEAARQLNKVRLDAGEARLLFDRAMRNVVLFLACDCVHADLSAFNILYWEGEIMVIDFPQATDPRSNPNAFPLLIRDVRNIYRYFRRYGLKGEGGIWATDLWERYERGTLRPDDMSRYDVPAWEE
jgi:RIO kinase 1